MPMFTKAEMNEHITRSGKHIANRDHHSVPTSLRKPKTFLEDEYLHEIMAASDQHCFYFKAKSCHSFRKNDPPHSLKVALCIVKGDVLDSNCTCVAGKVGFCNHISALMLKICKFTLLEVKSTKDLCEEKDENPDLACTSQLQKWHKKRGGENIFPQPVMEVVVKQAQLDESSSPRGVHENTFKSELSTLDPNMGFAQMSEGTSSTELTSSKFGKCPAGSILSYQTSFTESNFSAVANLTSVPRNNAPVNAQELNHYPRFPLSNDNDMVVPRELSDTEEALIKDLIVDEDRIHSIESATREQAGCDEWKTTHLPLHSFQIPSYLKVTKKSPKFRPTTDASKALFIKVCNTWLKV